MFKDFNIKVFSMFDYALIVLITPIVLISWYLINENNAFLGNKVLVYVFVGFIIFLGFCFLPIRKMGWAISGFYWVNIALLVAVELIGDVRLGAQRWIEIPFVHFTFQPSETMKPALILMLAYLIDKKPPSAKGYGIVDFAKLSIYILIPFVLVLKQPDLGTALVFVLMSYGMLFLIGVNYKIWLGLIIAVGVSSPLLYASLHDYQKKRIASFILEEPEYQVRQAMIAVGNGGLTGNQIEDATQSLLGFLPIATSDFIFPYYAERFGFVGVIGLFILYGSLIFHIFSMGAEGRTYGTDAGGRDYFLAVVSYSVGLLIFIYSGVNIAMTIGLAPVVGIPMPLLSYGGSSFITFMILFGILEHIIAFRYKFVYNHASFSK